MYEFRKVHNRYKYQLENFFAISLGIQDLFTKRVHAIVFNCAITNSFMQLLTTDLQWGDILSEFAYLYSFTCDFTRFLCNIVKSGMEIGKCLFMKKGMLLQKLFISPQYGLLQRGVRTKRLI